MSLEYSYDEETDIITIEGVKYSAGLFKSLPFPSDPDTWLRIISNEDGVITTETHRNWDEDAKIIIGDYMIHNQTPYGPMLENKLGEAVGIDEEKLDECWKKWF